MKRVDRNTHICTVDRKTIELPIWNVMNWELNFYKQIDDQNIWRCCPGMKMQTLCSHCALVHLKWRWELLKKSPNGLFGLHLKTGASQTNVFQFFYSRNGLSMFFAFIPSSSISLIKFLASGLVFYLPLSTFFTVMGLILSPLEVISSVF